ncbi:MAG: class I SAM-dependent methyltransferase [candidate division WOR-3 bacterium]
MNTVENICPLCESNETARILYLKIKNFDNSKLYEDLRINRCSYCGHIYNELTPEEFKNIMDYYGEEYSMTNIHAPEETGDRPGSKNPLTLKRYEILLPIIKRHVQTNARILDVGCAMGGFLDYLKENGFNEVYGIEPVVAYVDRASKNVNNVKVGSAESVPFDDEYFDVLIMDQVLEHLYEPRKAFREAKRVLKKGGYLFIGVPDAARYRETYFFDFYWFLLKEHIQHFDIAHLKILAESEGFNLIEFYHKKTPMMSETMTLPYLGAIFEKTVKENLSNKNEALFYLGNEMERYIDIEEKRLRARRKFISGLKKSEREVFVWGLGREFLYLYSTTELKSIIRGLIDASPYKQENLTLDGKRICSPSVIKEANKSSYVIITAIAHKNAIKASLKNMSYEGDIIEL